MNIEWVLDKLFEGGKIDESQQVEIDALKKQLADEIQKRIDKEEEAADLERQRRSSFLPNVWQALSALAAIAALLISLRH